MSICMTLALNGLLTGGGLGRKARRSLNKVRGAKILGAVAFLVTSKNCWC